MTSTTDADEELQPDLHWLHDTFIDDEGRRACLDPLSAALADWAGWPPSLQVRYCQLVLAATKQWLPLQPPTALWRTIWDAERLILVPDLALAELAGAVAWVAQDAPTERRDDLLEAACALWLDRAQQLRGAQR